MLIQRYVSQPSGGTDYLSLFRLALDTARFSRFDAAVAYATVGGVESLDETLQLGAGGQWPQIKKRWLVGIDWCRTEPLAFDRLASMPRSRVRIPSGADTVNRRACTPILSFHPKMFMLRGVESLALIVGSGNLSRNGLRKGHEIGSLVLVASPLAAHAQPLLDSNRSLMDWFDGMWTSATALAGIRAAYERQFEQLIRDQPPIPTDDDSAETESTHIILARRRRGLSPEQLRKLRACKHLWIQAGNLHENHGPGRPGNQLMLSAMTRIFFGFPAGDVDRDTFIGNVAIDFQNVRRNDCQLRFSNNSMDVLTLPVPGAGGPPRYDKETLMFEKTAGNRGVWFHLSLGNAVQIRTWRQRSNGVSAQYQMTSGRQWGVF